MSRLDQLNKLLQSSPNDPFVLYALAQEHAKMGAHERAIEFYDHCIAADPAYHYAYYHKAVALQSLARLSEARETTQAGLTAAQASSDAKAASELSALLESLEE